MLVTALSLLPLSPFAFSLSLLLSSYSLFYFIVLLEKSNFLSQDFDLKHNESLHLLPFCVSSFAFVVLLDFGKLCSFSRVSHQVSIQHRELLKQYTRRNDRFDVQREQRAKWRKADAERVRSPYSSLHRSLRLFLINTSCTLFKSILLTDLISSDTFTISRSLAFNLCSLSSCFGPEFVSEFKSRALVAIPKTHHAMMFLIAFSYIIHPLY